jgi:hypothetical protein
MGITQLPVDLGGTNATTKTGAAYNLHTTNIDYANATYVHVQTDSQEGGRLGIGAFRRKMFDNKFGAADGNLNASTHNDTPFIGTINITNNGPNGYTGWAYIFNIPHRSWGTDDPAAKQYRIQIVFPSVSSSVDNGLFYVRKCDNGVWTLWARHASIPVSVV